MNRVHLPPTAPYSANRLEQDAAPSEVEEKVVWIASASLPTAHGNFEVAVYRDGEGKEHLIVHMGNPEGEPPVVRLHSECLTGDVLGSVRCDCREQLQAALAYIARQGRGLLVYLRQEGRGIGLGNKVRAYALQDRGMDTVQANIHLGFPADLRSYRVAAAMLRDRGITCVRLLTNNPNKVADLESASIRVVERIPHQMRPGDHNRAYLNTKARKLGHWL